MQDRYSFNAAVFSEKAAQFIFGGSVGEIPDVDVFHESR